MLQAGAMFKGGEVFVLGMAEPVRIVDLAEKLYEELLIGDDVAGTQHPRILQAREEFFSWAELEPMLARLREACDRQDCEAARALLLEGVAGYSPTEQVEDLVWRGTLRKAAGDDSEAPDNVTRLEPRRGPAGHEKGPR